MSGRGHQMELMVSAITVGDLELVEDLLVGGVPVNANHRTPLSTAVREGQIGNYDSLDIPVLQITNKILHQIAIF